MHPCLVTEQHDKGAWLSLDTSKMRMTAGVRYNKLSYKYRESKEVSLANQVSASLFASRRHNYVCCFPTR